MAITTVTNHRPFKLGEFTAEPLDISAVSGATSGTITPKSIARLAHILMPAGFVQTAAMTISDATATLAFTVPAETTASRTIDGVLYTAVANLGAGGNSVTIRTVDGTGDQVPVTKGNEVVTVSSLAITVRIDPTAVSGSARNDVKAAVIASAAASALLVPSTVTAGTTVATVFTATPLQNGVTGGAAGTALCLGQP